MIQQTNGGQCLRRAAEKGRVPSDGETALEERVSRLERRLNEFITSMDTWTGRFAIALAALESRLEQRVRDDEHKIS